MRNKKKRKKCRLRFMKHEDRWRQRWTHSDKGSTTSVIRSAVVQQFWQQSVSIIHHGTHTFTNCLCPISPFERTWQWCSLDEWAACGCDSSHFPPTSHSEDMTQHSGRLAVDVHRSMLFVEKPATRAVERVASQCPSNHRRLHHAGSLENNDWKQITGQGGEKKIDCLCESTDQFSKPIRQLIR